MSVPNSFFVCLGFEDRCISWTPGKSQSTHVPDYFSNILNLLDQRLESSGLTFVLTWRLDSLPEYGDSVVAIVLGDEWGRVPQYSHKVLATFKCYGASPFVGYRHFLPVNHIKVMLTIRHFRVLMDYLPGAIRRLLQLGSRWNWRSSDWPPIIPIPLGYANQTELPIVPILDRGTDVFFGGSISHSRRRRSVLRRIIQSPKQLAREEMLVAFDMLLRKRPTTRLLSTTSQAFSLHSINYGTDSKGELLDKMHYSRTMMDTKISPVPRGTSAETFRFFEALRCGSIPIVESLPAFPFYEGSPAIEIEDWTEFADVATALLDDPERLTHLHEEALKWWSDRCSEEAITTLMVEAIDGLRHN